MTKDVDEIRNEIIDLLKAHLGPLKITSDAYENFEVSGTLPTMQGKKKVEGVYFSSVVPKAKDVRFYFFPLYTHRDQLGKLPEQLKKALKGKSCFHIKRMDEEMRSSLSSLIKKSIQVYQSDGLLKE